MVTESSSEGGDGGGGKPLGAAAGVPPARVTVLGAGVAGKHAARVASGMGAAVTVLDIDTSKLRRPADERLPGVATCCSSLQTVEDFALASDLIIGAVLVAGGNTPKIVGEDLVRSLPEGTVMVDISIDPGRLHPDLARDHPRRAGLHAARGDPLRSRQHPRRRSPQATYALTGTTLAYVLALSEGFEVAFSRLPELERGVNVAAGEYTHATVARALGQTPRDPRTVLGIAV